MKQDRIEGLVGKNVVLFTKTRDWRTNRPFRFQGRVSGYDGKFIEIYDEIKGKPKIVNVDEIIEVEVKEDEDLTTGVDKVIKDSEEEVHYVNKNKK